MEIEKRIRRHLKPRPRGSHKGDFGRVFILAGSLHYSGAPHLTASGALYSGAGLITLGVPECIYTVSASREAEVMVRPFADTADGSLAYAALKPVLEFAEAQDVLALGPGLSRNPQTARLVQSLAAKARMPLVIDADGLNAFTGRPQALEACRGLAVLTPHPGEFRRLFGEPGSTDAERKRTASRAAREHGVVVVLKGHHTVIASPSGGITVNPTGNPGMATGGTGDVLTGIIAALLGQGLSPEDAAEAGVFVHGLAGDLAARVTGETSLTAGALIRSLPAAFKKVLGR